MYSLTFMVASCGGGSDSAPTPPPPPPPPPASVQREIPFGTIDSAESANPSADATHPDVYVVQNPSASVTAANILFVFLPGTGAVPDQFKLILGSGAAKGFHTIGLDYPDPTAVGSSQLCGGNPDVNCFWNVRRQIILGGNDPTTGQPYSTLVPGTTADAIVTRLAKTLAYMQSIAPTEGWDQYLKTDGSVNWSKVTISGHSQGGGHAGVMTKLFSMHRACYFASPADWNSISNVPADWAGNEPNVTPASLQFGFTDTLDTFYVPYNQLNVIWQTMGLGTSSQAVSVDTTAAPYGNAHTLTTTYAALSQLALHSLPVADQATPIVNGAPLFDPVWSYLCFQ